MITLMLMLACEPRTRINEPVDTGLVTVENYMNTGRAIAFDEDIDTCYAVFNIVYLDTSYECEGSLWMKQTNYTYDPSISVIDGCRFEFEDTHSSITGWLRTEVGVSYDVGAGDCLELGGVASWDELTGEFNKLVVWDEFKIETHAYVKP